MSTTAQAYLRADRRGGARQPEVVNVTVEPDEKLLLSVVEAARRLGIGRTLMYELIRDGQVPSVHVGRLHRVPKAALGAYVARLTEAPADGG